MALNQAKAVTHIVPLGRDLEDDMYGPEMAEELTQKLISGEIVIPDLVRGDAIRIKSYPDSPDEWYRNDGLFLIDENGVVPLDNTIDDYGHVPENFSFPEFPADYWLDTVSHNNLVPVHLSELKKFQPKDVKTFSLRPGHLKDLTQPFLVPYVETQDYMILVPTSEGNIDPRQVITALNKARHVDVVKAGDDVLPRGDDQWEASYEDFNTDKTILVVLPESVYEAPTY